MAAGVQPVGAGALPAERQDGRIAMRVRIGVTGHRRLRDDAALAQEVRGRLELIGRLFTSTETTPVRFTVVSALAEGADRLVVNEAFRAFPPGTVELAAVLPLEPEDYLADFGTEASRTEFAAYLAGAAAVLRAPVVPGASRDSAYQQAGREVVDRSDVLIALWDGRPAQGRGGTGEVVAYAHKSGVAVLTVPTSAGADALPAADPGDLARRGPERLRSTREALRRLRRYNDDTRGLAALEREVAREPAWAPEIADGPVRALFDDVAGWARPHVLRAEVLARRAQREYFLLVDALFALAALAVVAVGFQISYEPERTRLALFETLALILLVVAFSVGRRARLHDAWIGYRSLAEAFRSSLFIAITGSREASSDGNASISRNEPWFQRAFTEAWGRRPQASPDRCDVAALRDLVVRAWLDDQISYHSRTGRRAERHHRHVTSIVQALLALAIVLSILHAFAVFEKTPWASDTLEFLAIVLPGVSAALTGHREHRQYRLNAERSRRTAERLRRVRRELAAAPDIPAVRRLAAEAQAIMVEENRDWFGVAELQELEVSL